MPRPKKPPRLYLRHRAGRPAQWVILDGAKEAGTGAGAEDADRAAQALEAYLVERHQPSDSNAPEDLLVDEVMASYLREHVPDSPSRAWIADMAAPIVEWWSGKTLDQINGPTCRAYVQWRTSQRIKWKPDKLISDQTARHELKCLRAAIEHYHREHGPLRAVPVVTLPPGSPQKENYYLTRGEAAQRIRIAKKLAKTRHVARMILIGVYTGTRPGATLGLGWLPSPTGGWFDLDAGILCRRPFGSKRTRKKQPPARIHCRLLLHLGRRKAADLACGVTRVIHYQGGPIERIINAWKSVRVAAGHARHDTPHILRHTAATWQMQAGTDVYEVAGYLGMSVKTLLEVYGHHHPDFQKNAAQAMPKKHSKVG